MLEYDASNQFSKNMLQKRERTKFHFSKNKTKKK